LIGAVALTWLVWPTGLHAQIPELHPTANPIGDKPVAPRDAIPVPVIPDKMAVPAPTVADKIEQATPPAEVPGVDTNSGGSIPEEELKEVAPPAATRVR
jgi:hypothetical protein